MKITITVFENDKEILTKTFGEGVFRAGRSEFSDILLPSDKISRSHIEFRMNEAAIYFTNMSSPGLVKLNGKPKETGEIADGDELVAGPYRILVVYGDIAQVAAGGEAVAEPPPGFGGEAGLNAPDAGEDFRAPGGMTGAQAREPETPEAASSGFATPLREKLSQASASLGQLDTDVELKPVVAKLVFTAGPKAGDDLVLEAYEVTFGRSKKADIFLDDDRLSRVHAKIVRVGMGYRLVDLDSHNGTFVNGMRVLEHPLASFDEIELGSSKIKFLVHDVVMANLDPQRAGPAMVGSAALKTEQTASVAIAALEPEKVARLRVAPDSERQQPYEVSDPLESELAPVASRNPLRNLNRRTQIILAAIIGLLVIFLLLPSGERSKDTQGNAPIAKSNPASAPSAMPKEYAELSEDIQRSVEGHYNSALKAADAQDFDSAVAHLKSIHDYLPYYKKSRELMDKYQKKVKEKQIAEAQEKAKNDEKQDLAMYIQDGIDYLKEGDFDKAGEAFNSAIVIDPTNPIASKGLRAADAKVRDMDQLPPEIDPEMEKKKAVLELFQRAVGALQAKQYQEAINSAEQVRKIELKGDAQYLNEAKQIIDQAKILQKEEFEPFLISAKEKFAEGDYNESRNLCEEMLKKDSSYEEARECVLKARKNLNRLAKEAYTHGYILESMNRIEEAKQYWNRAKNYVRPGDDYHDKILRKLDYYQ